MNRQGEYITNLSGESAYKSFRPSPLPPNPPIVFDDELIKLLVQANKQISLLNGLSLNIPNKKLFIAMYIRKEALVSSQIEGTQCTFDDVLDPNIEKNINSDVSDVVNYIKATEYAIERLNTLPLCNRLLKETHKELMKGVRGGEKTPGEFRKSQNWIGGQNSTIKNANYIPPSPIDMIESLSDLEKYYNTEDDLDPLIKASLIHYQFETIHPFLDGNGRIGRLLIILFLLKEKVLNSPILYLSCYLKSNRVEYYDRMTEIRKNGNYEQWIKFFLRAVSSTCIDAIETIKRLVALHEETLNRINTEGRLLSKLQELVCYLEKSPIIDVKKTSDALNFSYNSTAKYIDILKENGILEQTSQIGKTKIYSYTEYLNILRKDT